MKIETTNRHGKVVTHIVRCNYLVKFVNPNQEYPVTYTIKQDGTIVTKPSTLKGEDLTEPQITELFVNELL